MIQEEGSIVTTTPATKPQASADIVQAPTATSVIVDVPTAAPACGCGDETAAGGVHHHGYIESKENYQRRLRRIEGQARGLQRMIDEEKYCIDILTQISAMTRALQVVALALLDDHMSSCVVEAARAGGPEADEKLREAAEAIARLVRS